MENRIIFFIGKEYILNKYHEKTWLFKFSLLFSYVEKSCIPVFLSHRPLSHWKQRQENVDSGREMSE